MVRKLQKKVEREWGPYPCIGLGKSDLVTQHALRFGSSVVETGQKLTASQRARSSKDGRFFEPRSTRPNHLCLPSTSAAHQDHQHHPKLPNQAREQVRVCLGLQARGSPLVVWFGSRPLPILAWHPGARQPDNNFWW